MDYQDFFETLVSLTEALVYVGFAVWGIVGLLQ